MFLKLVATFAIAVASLGSALAPVVATERPLKIVALGDSLTAGYGLPATDAFPVKLAHALEAKGIKVQIVNAGVSGDTTAGGLARLEWSLPSDTDAVILELGANDAMRGIDPKITRDALAAILTKLKERGVAVLLCGMYAPPTWALTLGVRIIKCIRNSPAAMTPFCIRSFSTASPATVSSIRPTEFIRPARGSI